MESHILVYFYLFHTYLCPPSDVQVRTREQSASILDMIIIPTTGFVPTTILVEAQIPNALIYTLAQTGGDLVKLELMIKVWLMAFLEHLL